MPYHGFTCDGQQWFGACHVSAGRDLHGGGGLQSRVRGRIRVPLEGPPARMTPFVLGIGGGGWEYGGSRGNTRERM